MDSLRADLDAERPAAVLSDSNGADLCDHYLSSQHRPAAGYLGEPDFSRIVRPMPTVTVAIVMIDRGHWSIALSPDYDEVLAAIRIRGD